MDQLSPNNNVHINIEDAVNKAIVELNIQFDEIKP